MITITGTSNSHGEIVNLSNISLLMASIFASFILPVENCCPKIKNTINEMITAGTVV